LLRGEVRFPVSGTDGKSDSIVLGDFLVDGRPPRAEPRLRQLSTGVTEVTLEASAAGEWSFAVTDNGATSDSASASTG